MDTTAADSICAGHSASSTGAGWYVVQAAPRQERNVQRALERLGYATMMLLVEVRIGENYTTLRNLIRPYFLVRFDRIGDPWAEILEVEGVGRIVGNRFDMPVPVPDNVVAELAFACAIGVHDESRKLPPASPRLKGKKTRRSSKPRNKRRLKRAARMLKHWITAHVA